MLYSLDDIPRDAIKTLLLCCTSHDAHVNYVRQTLRVLYSSAEIALLIRADRVPDDFAGPAYRWPGERLDEAAAATAAAALAGREFSATVILYNDPERQGYGAVTRLAAAVASRYYVESYYTTGRYPLSFYERRFLTMTADEFKRERLAAADG